MKNLLFTISIMLGVITQAQDLQNFYSYSINWANINHAYVGANGSLEGALVSRTEFNDVGGSPKNIMALVAAGISDTQGVGVKMINDNRGIFSTTRFDAIYSQRFDFNNDNSYIRFGMSFGALNSSLDLSDINNRDAVLATGDPEVNSSKYNYTHFVSGAGMIVGIKDFEVGVSSPHLLESNRGFEPYLIGTMAYSYAIPGSDFSVRPSVLYQNKPDQDNVTNGFLNISWKDLVTLITGYTSDERLRLGGGIKIKDFAITYLTENPTGNNSFSNSTQEIGISIALNGGKKKQVVGLQGRIQELLEETRELAYGNYDKDYLRRRLIEIDQELDEIMAANTSQNSREVSVQLEELEGQILHIIEKFELQSE